MAMSKLLLTSVFTFVLFLSNYHVWAQETLVGLWEIKTVTVGEEMMTPVAKWTRINADGSFQSGNGWLQNSSGSWNYDVHTQIYSSIDSLDVADEFGGFKVSFESENMIWERLEEGMNVKVLLEKISTLPKSTADHLEGLWELTEISESGNSLTDEMFKDGQPKIHFRWDRIYVFISPEGERSTGYWHIHGHRPEITLLPHSADEQAESWSVVVNEKDALFRGISDSNQGIDIRYVRVREF